VGNVDREGDDRVGAARHRHASSTSSGLHL
jgi:hypothetical protein